MAATRPGSRGSRDIWIQLLLAGLPAPSRRRACCVVVVGLLMILMGVAGAAGPAASDAGPSPAPRSGDTVDLEPVPVPEPSPLALQYHRTGQWLWLLNQTLAIAIPAAIAFSGLSARIRNLAARIAFGFRPPTIVIYVALYLTLIFLLELPLAYYQGYIRPHSYELSNQTFSRWIYHRSLGLAVNIAASSLIALIGFAVLRRSPGRWWLYLGLGSVPILIFAMLIVPIWIDPLFNHYGPMKNKELERQILDLASRAGIEGGRVFEVDKSVDTKTINAYVTGVWNSKRIVLWDTLIAALEPREALFVMGHEMGHYVLGHVIRTLVLAPVLVIPTLWFVNWWCGRLLRRYQGRLGFSDLADVAAVPLLLFTIEASSLVTTPIGLWYSRVQESAADQFGLDLTHDNHAAASALVKLQTENLGVPRYGLIERVFRASHPCLGDRIDFCNRYHPWRESRPAG